MSRRDEVVAEYRLVVELLVRSLQDRHPAMGVAETINLAHVVAWREVNGCIKEAVRQVGIERAPEVFGQRGASAGAEDGGAPDHELAALRAMRTLAFHADADDASVKDETLEDLLADLLHWAKPEEFAEALDAAAAHYEAERDEEEGREGEPADSPVHEAPTSAEERQRARLQAQRLARLHAHRPGRYDA